MLHEWSDRDPDPPSRRPLILTFDFWLAVMFIVSTILGLVSLADFVWALVKRIAGILL
jgi:hypothetical protein